MAKRQIGKLPPRYSFLLNGHPDSRLSKCPECHKPTHLRKFALLLHIDGWGLITQGKTCRYCTPCEIIMAHQDELEAQLAESLMSLAPEVIGNYYLALGTVDMRFWQRGLQGSDFLLEEALKHTADFKQHLTLVVEPGGWFPATQR